MTAGTTEFFKIESELDLAFTSLADQIVVLGYGSFADCCQATKPHLEALAREYGFELALFNCDRHIDAERAGTLMPSVTVFRKGHRVAPPLLGARTRKSLKQYLAACGVIEHENLR